MVCDCCGRKKKLFESFAAVQYEKVQIYFCAACNDLAYKVRDDANDRNKVEYEKHLKEWEMRAKKPSDLFLEWQKDFRSSLEKTVENEET